MKATRQPSYRDVMDRRPLRTRVRAILLDLIATGALAPSEQLREEELSTHLGISRTPLREALFGLEAEGLVRSDPARGFFVVPMTRDEVVQTYPVLWTLEDLALASTAPGSTIDAVRLRAVNALLREAVDPVAMKDLDNEWHGILVSGCANPTLRTVIDRIKETLRRYEIAYMQDSGRVKDSAEQHEALTALVEEGRLRDARRALEHHWRSGMDRLLEWLG